MGEILSFGGGVWSFDGLSVGVRVQRGRSGTEVEFPATHMGPPALIPEVFQDYLSSDFNIF